MSRHIERKRKKIISIKKEKEIPEERKAKFAKLFKKLNLLEKELLEESGGKGSGGKPNFGEIDKLTIIPPEGNSPPEEYRTFSIYTPIQNMESDPTVRIFLDETKGKFELSENKLSLRKHPKNKNYSYSSFKIKGFRKYDKTYIIAKNNNQEELAEFSVLLQKEKRAGKDIPKRHKGGMIKGISFNITENKPKQRVFFNRKEGIITIFLNFPGISPYLGEGGDGSDTESGSILLSELIAESFCRETAREKLEEEGSLSSDIEQYLNFYNDHLKRCIPVIHQVWISK